MARIAKTVNDVKSARINCDIAWEHEKLYDLVPAIHATAGTSSPFHTAGEENAGWSIHSQSIQVGVSPISTALARRNQDSPNTAMATRSSRFGRKIVNSSSGRYHAMYNPPPYPFQYWVASMTVVEQLNNVPRFFWAGQSANAALMRTAATSTGIR